MKLRDHLGDCSLCGERLWSGPGGLAHKCEPFEEAKRQAAAQPSPYVSLYITRRQAETIVAVLQGDDTKASDRSRVLHAVLKEMG